MVIHFTSFFYIIFQKAKIKTESSGYYLTNMQDQNEGENFKRIRPIC